MGPTSVPGSAIGTSTPSAPTWGFGYQAFASGPLGLPGPSGEVSRMSGPSASKRPGIAIPSVTRNAIVAPSASDSMCARAPPTAPPPRTGVAATTPASPATPTAHTSVPNTASTRPGLRPRVHDTSAYGIATTHSATPPQPSTI